LSNTAATHRAEIAIVGASLGGVLAAWQACRALRNLEYRVILLAEFDWLGGQMTSQGVPPDEHPAIERGGASTSYLAFRRAIRAQYLANANFVDRTELTEGANPGDGWVSRLCFEPSLAAAYFDALLAPFVQNGKLLILRGVSGISASRTTRNVEFVKVKMAAGEATIHARMFIDATDTGELIRAAALDYRLGKEARQEFDEPDAPRVADRLDQQPVTFVMALRSVRDVNKDSTHRVIERSAAYEKWAAYELPHYQHRLFSESMPGSGRGHSARLPFTASGQTLDWWRYRRVVSARNWRHDVEEVSLVNWAQNDYALEPLLDGASSMQQVGDAAKELSRSFLYWLQTEGGHPEWQLAADVLGTEDGFAQQVYVRESRRIKGITTLAQKDILARDGDLTPTTRSDSVGIGWYNMDIHPTVVSGHGVNARVRPFCLPAGVFVPNDCDNLIPASKNISVTHLVNAATRVHPIEWLIGEVAGILAATAISDATTPREIVTDVTRLSRLQSQLHGKGIPTQWDRDVLAGVTPH
jgi:hypothetical protein